MCKLLDPFCFSRRPKRHYIRSRHFKFRIKFRGQMELPTGVFVHLTFALEVRLVKSLSLNPLGFDLPLRMSIGKLIHGRQGSAFCPLESLASVNPSVWRCKSGFAMSEASE